MSGTWDGVERRKQPRTQLVEDIARAVRAEISSLTVPEEQHRRHHDFLDELIEREKRRTAFRDAVIEKSVASLVWSGLVGMALAVWSYAKEHIK